MIKNIAIDFQQLKIAIGLPEETVIASVSRINNSICLTVFDPNQSLPHEPVWRDGKWIDKLELDNV